jgi:RNA polymerase sigma factor (sigma-70 family)
MRIELGDGNTKTELYRFRNGETIFTKPVHMYQNLSDEIFDQFKSGDVDALKQIYLLYFRDLYGYVKKLIKDETDAKGIARDCFIKLRDYRSNIRDPDHLRRYLFHMVKTGCADYYRQKRPARDAEIEYLRMLVEDEQYLLEEDLKSEMLSIIERHIPLLPEQYQEVLRLIYREGLKPGEAATRLGKSAHSVYLLHSRALGRLKELIGPTKALGFLLIVYFLLYADKQLIVNVYGK